MLVLDLVASLPSDTRERVEDTYSMYRTVVREAISKELRLPLTWGRSEAVDTWHCSCAVSVDEIGMPETIGRLKIPDEFVLAAKLQMWLPSLRSFSGAAIDLRDLANSLANELAEHIDVPEFRKSIDEASDVVELLLKLASLKDFDLTAYILSVNEDVMGVFSYNPNEGKNGYKRAYRTDARLYWGVIGLISRTLGVSIEGLTVKVLAHELAHAYTHLGFDRDGKRWTGESFGNAEHALVEGLAQYYAALCLDRLRRRIPEAWDAYEELLPKQPPAYQGHTLWLEESSPEQVGAALARIRQQPSAQYAEFCALLGLKPPELTPLESE